MDIKDNLTYILYLIQTRDDDKHIFLGTGRDPIKLYQNALNPQTVNAEIKSLILKWFIRVEANLNEQEQRDMDYAFMHNPEKEFSYSIQNMTLVIKQIKQF
jgi:hypothetical protein